jgi:hypothetical protein
MPRLFEWIPIIVMLASIVVIFGISFHSLEEIHYFKSFYPKSFTVEAAFYASLVELIKIAIISFPFLLLTGLSLYWMKVKSDHAGR